MVEKWRAIPYNLINSYGYAVSDCGRVAFQFGQSFVYKIGPYNYRCSDYLNKKDYLNEININEINYAYHCLIPLRKKNRYYVTLPMQVILEDGAFIGTKRESYGMLFTDDHTFAIDELVCKVFCDPVPNEEECVVWHKNGLLLDNRADNLVWKKKGETINYANSDADTRFCVYVLPDDSGDEINIDDEIAYKPVYLEFENISDIEKTFQLSRDIIWKKIFNKKRKNILKINNKKIFFTINYFNTNNIYFVYKKDDILKEKHGFTTILQAAEYVCYREHMDVMNCKHLVEKRLTDVLFYNKADSYKGWCIEVNVR